MKAILCHYSRPDLLVRQLPFVQKFVTKDIHVITSGVHAERSIGFLAKKLNAEYTPFVTDLQFRDAYHFGINEMIKRYHAEDDLVFFEADVFPTKRLPDFGDKQFWSPAYRTRLIPEILMVKKNYPLEVDKTFHTTAFDHPNLGKWDIRRVKEPPYPEYIEDFAVHLDKSEHQKPPHEHAKMRLEMIDELEKEYTVKKSMLNAIVNAVGSTVKTSILRYDRTTDEQFNERMSICSTCDHVTKNRKGEPFTCGPMLESLTNPDLSTCGCVLRKKARDKKQKCPHGFWPDIE